MVAFYNQGDQEIYEGGQHYIPQEQYRLGKFSNTVAPMPMDGTQQVTQNFGIPYTGAFTNAGGGGGGGGLGGKFGNLDLSKTKTFNKNVFKTTGPVKGWDMSEVTGYYDPQTNTYKTLEGKNIEHGGLFTGDPKEGDIEGVPFKFPGITSAIAQWLKNKAIAAKDKIGDTFKGNEVVDEKITGGDVNVLGPDNPLIGNIDHTGGGITRDPGSVVEGAPTHSTRDDLMAAGGRVGFFEGALADTAEGQAMSPGTSATGEFRGGQGDGGQGDGLTKKLNISPVMETSDTALGWDMPTGKFGIESLSKLGQMKAMLDLRHLIESGGKEANPEFSYQGNVGPVDINATYSDDVQNIGATLNKNNLSANINYDAITGEPSFNLGYYKQFNNGGLVSIL
jgi:hypothetical protein